jgi:chromosome segregation ATPase
MRTSRLFGGRSHDEAREVGAPVLDIAVERFDYVPVDIGNALLRVTGAWGSAPGAVAPTLVVEASDQVLQFAPLPDLPTAAGAGSAGRRWRGGYAVPTDLVTSDSRYSLWWEGRSILLPLPSGGLADSEEANRHLEELGAVRNELEAERGARAELEARLAQFHEALVVAEQERDEARAGVEVRTAQLAEAERLAPQVAGLEAEVTTLTARVEEAVAAIEQLREERTRLQQQWSQATAEASQAIADRDARGAEQARLEQELESFRTAAAETSDRAATEVAELQARLAEAQDEIRIHSERLAEVQPALDEREALEGSLAKAREVVASQDSRISELEQRLEATVAEHERAQARVSELEQDLSVREEAVMELHRLRVEAEQRAGGLEQELDNSRETLRRALRERLWEVQT